MLCSNIQINPNIMNIKICVQNCNCRNFPYSASHASPFSLPALATQKEIGRRATLFILTQRLICTSPVAIGDKQAA